MTGRLPKTLRIDAASRRVALDPNDPDFVQDPYGAYRAILTTCKTFFWEDYGHWCLAGHAEVNALLRDRRFGREILHVASREQLGWPEVPERLKPFYDFEHRSMLEREPPAHTRLRGVVNRAFVTRAIERLRPRVEALAHALVDRMEGQRETDLLPAFAEPIPVEIIAGMLGVSASSAPQLLDWSHRMVAMYQFNRTPEIEHRAVEATLEFSAFIKRHLGERRRGPGEDILSLMLEAAASGEALSEEEVVTNAILLLNAGHEATVHAIGNGVAGILRSGVDPASLFETPDRTAATVEELLRFEPPLHLFTRYALKPVSLEGIDFQVGDRIGLLLGAANRDPVVYDEADRFEPDRPPKAHVSFGAGIHFCIGAPLARLELQTALPILFRRLPGLRLAAPLTYADRYHFHGLETLRVAY